MVLGILGYIHEMFSNCRIEKLVHRMREKMHRIYIPCLPIKSLLHGNTIEIR